MRLTILVQIANRMTLSSGTFTKDLATSRLCKINFYPTSN